MIAYDKRYSFVVAELQRIPRCCFNPPSMHRGSRRARHGLDIRLEPAADGAGPVAEGAGILQVVPPLQDPASYNLDQVMEELKKAPVHPSQ
jgi:hypothetical protein